ncbi:hypothetical protein LCGC14_3002210 [marine sediment metagenome]|uniref:Uncharacterized protein n=1 Tax=marine sediment metagenome TaxID=412755 RepID=A0A0F8ZRT2_9ZZZZ
MPLSGVRYRMHKTDGLTRLAFRGGSAKAKTGTVVEAKNMRTGATHTPAEFAADRRKQRRRSHFPNRRHSY